MKFYPDADVWFYVEKPNGWDSYQRHPANYSWKLPKQDRGPKTMWYWRDIDGPKMEVTRDDLCFENWPKSRIREEACLGMLYATGNRFVKVGSTQPADFKCAPLPVNLEMARNINKELVNKKKRERNLAREAKLAKKAAGNQKAKSKKSTAAPKKKKNK